MSEENEYRIEKSILNKLNCYKHLLLVFKEYLNNPSEKSREIKLDGNNLLMSLEILQSKSFKYLLVKNSDNLKKIAKEKEGEITKKLKDHLTTKNISYFNQTMFKNVKRDFNRDNDIELTKDMLSKLLLKNISNKLINIIVKEKTLKKSKSTLSLNLTKSVAHNSLKPSNNSMLRNNSSLILNRLLPLIEKRKEVLTKDSLLKSLKKYDQRGIITMERTLKDVAKQLKIDKKDLDSHRFDNIIDSLKHTDSLRQNMLLQREITSKQNNFTRVFPVMKKSILRKTLNICVNRIQVEDELISTKEFNNGNRLMVEKLQGEKFISKERNKVSKIVLK